jgi:sec-independent protein translocase protein TatB
MFGIDSSELAIIALVALLVIGPKDLPRVMRQVGQWMAKGRAMTRHVRAGFDTMMRESELEEMQAQWAAQNDAIMKATALPDLGLRGALPDYSGGYGSDNWSAPPETVDPLPTDPALSGTAPAEPALAAAAAPPAKSRRSRAKPAPPALAPADATATTSATPPIPAPSKRRTRNSSPT